MDSRCARRGRDKSFILDSSRATGATAKGATATGATATGATACVRQGLRRQGLRRACDRGSASTDSFRLRRATAAGLLSPWNGSRRAQAHGIAAPPMRQWATDCCDTDGCCDVCLGFQCQAARRIKASHGYADNMNCCWCLYFA